MEKDNMILAEDLCSNYNIEITFIQSLEESGLLHTEIVENKSFIHSDQLPQLEKFVHLHYDLEINIAGLEAISHLLGQIESLQNQIWTLKNRLGLYE